MNNIDFGDQIRDFAKEELNFDLIGFAKANSLTEEGSNLEAWLNQNRHGSMEWIERRSEARSDPRLILPSVKSVIVVAKNYYAPDSHPDSHENAKISRYAWGRDYHRILPKKLKKLHSFLLKFDESIENRWFVDAGPVMEKPWAVKAGIGWQGKHTNVITRSHGSWVFLGVMFTSVELPYDSIATDMCGSCRECIDACPTDALTAPYEIDARKCISYVTIEQRPREEIETSFGDLMDRWVVGCDICQDVCPWNKFQQPTDENDFYPRPGSIDIKFDEIERMDQTEFLERFQGSPVMRTKLEGLKRNGKGANIL